ncbi:mg2+ transporter [Trichoderma arundinaceum]|uniref:Mg2+ transporter n=1 Tax=Trichoderma arundinaceum TaxID=490622 RepID=A0A395NR63_TRIAR|nr:mg2+ transporter [Trichoderma arundinaceum]
MTCPLLDDELKTVSIKVIDKIKEKFLRDSENGQYIEPGSVLRCTGTYPQPYSITYSQKHRPTVPIIFVASPYLALSPLSDWRGSDEDDEYYPRTLLQNLYRFDVAPNRDKTQIIRKICRGKQLSDVLHVNQMWCLLIGSNILITMSDHESDKLLTGTIEKRTSGRESPIKIKIVDDDSHSYHDIVVSLNTTWVDLFNITMDVVQRKRSDFAFYELRDLSKHILTAERWIEIVKARASQYHTFHLTRRTNNPIKKMGLLEYSHTDINETLDGQSTKRRRSDGSSEVAGSYEEPTETEERNPYPESNIDSEYGAGGIIISSPDTQKKRIISPVIDGSFAGYLKPEVTSLYSSSKESSINVGEDASTLQAADDMTEPTTVQRNVDVSDPLGIDSSSKSRQLPHDHIGTYQDIDKRTSNQFANNMLTHNFNRRYGYKTRSSPHGSSAEHSRFPLFSPAGAHLIDSESSRNPISRPNSGKIQDPRHSAPIIMKNYESHGDLASAMSDIDGYIDLTETGGSINDFTARRRQGKKVSSEISVEFYPFEDDPKASNDVFLRRSPSYYRSKHLRQGSHSRIFSPFLPSYNRSPGFVNNDRMKPLRYISESNNEIRINESHESRSGGKKRAFFPKLIPNAIAADDTVNPKTNADKAQGSRLSKIVPFFLWGPSIPISSLTPQGAKEEKMVELLTKVHKDISNSRLGKYYYVKIPEFTEEEFISRQEFLNGSLQDGSLFITKDDVIQMTSGTMINDQKMMGGLSSHNSSNDIKKVDKLQVHGGKVDSAKESASNDLRSEINFFTKERDDLAMKQEQSLGILSHDKALMKELVNVSGRIIRSFIPSVGSSTVHPLLKRFWGCLDIICRQLIWEENERVSVDEHAYIVRNFSAQPQRTDVNHSPSSHKALLPQCEACRGGKHYSSAEEALNHLHNEHLDCQHKCKRPYDDPCYVWLHRIWHSKYPERNERDGLLLNLKTFIHDLFAIQEQINELHAMVTSREDESMGVMAIRPLLPRNISYAFQQVIQIFVLQSKILSLMMRRRDPSSHSVKRISEKITELQRFEEDAKHQTQSLLHHAKRDIFLSGNTFGDIERRQPQSAGAELLALAFICEGQNLLFQTNLELPQTKENAIKLYKGYTSKLHFQANQRPRKRVFLDIHDLEEELEALHILLGHQRDCLDRFAKSISPDTLRLTTATRVAQNKVENLYKDSHLRQLEARRQEIENMVTRSIFLKEKVKQTIEILEEDHGKAIRVFTIVTLFFLPLSFVSSFLGMNTADVRNMNNNQWLFWATGIPVTIFVLTLACIYGYKGDEIRDWMIQRPHGPRNKILRLGFGRGEEHATTKKPRRFTDHGRRQLSVMPMPREQSEMQLDVTGSGQSKEQKNVKPSMERGDTLDSLTLFTSKQSATGR